MKTILLYLFVAVAAVVAYQAVSFLTRYLKTRSSDALWCFAFALISSLYALSFIPLYAIEGPAMAAAIRLTLLAGFLALGLYIKCMMVYFGSSSRPLTIGVGVILTTGVLYGCLAVYDLATGSQLLVAPKAQPLDIRSALLPDYFVSRYDMLGLTRYPHAICRLIALTALVYLLLCADTKRDRLVQLGVIVSVACLIHNMVSVNWAVGLYAPLLPFMNLIEITRLEWLARRGDALRLERYEQRIESFEHGFNEHVKLKEIGQQAATFIHDASNHAFVTDSKLSMAELDDAVTRNTTLRESISTARKSNQQLMQLLSSGRDDYLRHNSDEPIDLNTVIADAVELTAYRLLANNIKLTTQGESRRELLGDRVKLAQTLVNLINNPCDAIAHLPERWVRIGIEDRDDQTVVSVTNSGEKISPELWDEVFSPFFSTKAEIGGTGLGLKICRDNLAAMGGELLLSPDSEHTRFEIVLP